jgi:hypothetical protein
VSIIYAAVSWEFGITLKINEIRPTSAPNNMPIASAKGQEALERGNEPHSQSPGRRNRLRDCIIRRFKNPAVVGKRG